jgi:hypothetical protein
MLVTSMAKAARRPLMHAMALALGLLFALVAVTPAQASDWSGARPAASWQTAAATAAPAPSHGLQALCFPPTRYTNGAVWQCEVFSGQFIQVWMVCGGVRYTSAPIGEGSWWITGVCPAGTFRTDDGVIGA